MRIVGIVSEYNPFHLGHKYHVEMSRELAGADAVVCVMSGDFVQRGEPAAFSKHARAKAAVRCGVDLVIELPLPWALSSAEGFSRGAVALLDSLGVVTHLSFGSECGDLQALDLAARALLRPEMDEMILAKLCGGQSYAAARQAALETVLGEDAKIIETPNNILAVEYLKAVTSLGAGLEPVTVLRQGAGHDEALGVGVKSASDLRSRLARGDNISRFVPEACAQVLAEEARFGRSFVSVSALETAMLSRLRMLGEGYYAKLPGAGEGLYSRLCAAAWAQPTVEAVLAEAKSKRYAMSRLRRMLMCAALGVTEEMQRGLPPYARILALNGKGREVLRQAGECARLPIITKPAAVRGLSRGCIGLFELGSMAHDFYVLGYGNASQRGGGEDWRASPFVEA